MLYCYTRVSSSTQADGNGVDSQLAAIRHWLKGQAIDPDGCLWYSDLAVSGSTMDRPEWERMLADVAAHQGARTIVVNDLTRAGRSLVGLATWVDAMLKQGVGLVFVKEGLDASTPTGKLLLGILGSVAEFELAAIRERIGRGVKVGYAKRNGVWGGRRVAVGARGGPSLTPEQHESLLKDHASGMKYPALGVKYGIHRNTARLYCLRPRAPKPAAP